MGKISIAKLTCSQDIATMLVKHVNSTVSNSTWIDGNGPLNSANLIEVISFNHDDKEYDNCLCYV